MKLKIDENLPKEIKKLLTITDNDVLTVVDQNLGGVKDAKIAEICKSENRVLVTLDLDFSDIRAYPPKEYPGIIVIRVYPQIKNKIIETFSKVLPLLKRESIAGHLWIVEENRVRIRS